MALAMLPLALLNGRTLVGCGCTGHFEAVCHCGCAMGCGGCCGQGGTRACCAKRTATETASDAATQHARGHHCTQIVEYVVVPATVAPTVAADDSQASATVLAVLDLPILAPSTHAGQFVDLATRPPNDLVVVLHRLVI
jgi:hypothetical protein